MLSTSTRPRPLRMLAPAAAHRAPLLTRKVPPQSRSSPPSISKAATLRQPFPHQYTPPPEARSSSTPIGRISRRPTASPPMPIRNHADPSPPLGALPTQYTYPTDAVPQNAISLRRRHYPKYRCPRSLSTPIGRISRRPNAPQPMPIRNHAGPCPPLGALPTQYTYTTDAAPQNAIFLYRRRHPKCHRPIPIIQASRNLTNPKRQTAPTSTSLTSSPPMRPNTFPQ